MTRSERDRIARSYADSDLDPIEGDLAGWLIVYASALAGDQPDLDLDDCGEGLLLVLTAWCDRTGGRTFRLPSGRLAVTLTPEGGLDLDEPPRPSTRPRRVLVPSVN